MGGRPPGPDRRTLWWADRETIDKSPPRLERYDRWGKEVCRIVHHPATLAAKRDAWEAGISGPRLRREAERRGRPFPAVMTGALNYLLCQADTGLMCAIGMTSGVVGLVERFAPPEIRERLLARLTAERFEDAWDGAMFMTEQGPGSDISATETKAEIQPDGTWRLTGDKWFCSNADADLAMQIASENLAFCSNWGIPAGSAEHNSCVQDLIGIRARAEEGVRDEVASQF